MRCEDKQWKVSGTQISFIRDYSPIISSINSRKGKKVFIFSNHQITIDDLFTHQYFFVTYNLKITRRYP